MKMPNIRDFAGEEKVVILHSEIRDVHRLAADVDYFFRKAQQAKASLSCEDALHVVTQKQIEQIPPSKKRGIQKNH